MQLLELLPHFALACNQNTFFGFPHWYEYLTVNQFTTTNGRVVCQVQFSVLKDLPLILLAIVDILLRLGALVAVGFVIYGGLKYITSQGEPDATSEARSTIINALIGLVVCLLSVTIVSFIGFRLGG